jgi:hypothetical protein
MINKNIKYTKSCFPFKIKLYSEWRTNPGSYKHFVYIYIFNIRTIDLQWRTNENTDSNTEIYVTFFCNIRDNFRKLKHFFNIKIKP